MDIERLSKSQIVLLTLLISFITSIATGIVTVSLMDQAPPVVAQTVNRVIERTVQQVVPQNQPAAAAVTQEKTIIVKESDLISQAVAKMSPSVVRIYSSDAQSPEFLGLGVVIDASGTIATDASILPDTASAVAEIDSASHVRAFVTSREATSGVAFLRTATSTQEGGQPVWKPVTLSVSPAVLGETVIVLTGKTATRVADGIVSQTIPESDSSSASIDTSIPASSILPGTPLVATDGSLIGLSTGVSRMTGDSAFIGASALMQTSASAVQTAPSAK